MAIIPKCEYCKHNAGEDMQFRFMWHCKELGYCVSFGYKRKHSEKEEPQYCKALFLGKGSFVLDEVKKMEFEKKELERKKKEKELDQLP
ncbi:hypothetical protein [Dysgonomonas sp. GY617]|uniref:hypothetical protein n=1 Tax=Dysgonomonas sp. GY617 TaxID=2780420 RepID=UPI00188463BF|nr:hypothetical protein [Dysgonomonas sp. GY617]MBF0577710.1 hypothetical protein [Dysgonomonas sp. GY617]